MDWIKKTEGPVNIYSSLNFIRLVYRLSFSARVFGLYLEDVFSGMSKVWSDRRIFGFDRVSF